MLCPRCHGIREILVDDQPLPCPECEGRGEIHCCEGLQAQPGEEENHESQESGK